MSSKISDSAILTIREVAGYQKVTKPTICRLAAAKKIPGFKVGGMWRFRQTDIDAWIVAQSENSEAQ
ncbi:helix-turn-helix domain-containing protein [Achromobacter ruhlandii]|uniref:Helix-turn-helix domain-containing protein n=1 Tax=Achromobacter ruhlandii TaxID=72557 RepID=A0A2M9H0S3_9BURK|nr:helix-turn-helix domain-containing protein [Achromobacter ruhlandii]PJM70423.1 DNA-binding protein [Achromobacter ruhlandii]CAB3834280.1 hypothetical protein LMG3328_00922 [Achromobacter ruhlandii]